MGIGSIFQLKKEFASAQPFDQSELRGYYEVRLVTGLLPDIRFFKHFKFFPNDVEKKGGGFNEFFGFFRIGDFNIKATKSILGDGENVLNINYNRAGNPFWLKPLNDELKKRENYYIGRGVFNLLGIKFNSFYFSLKKSNKQ